jgi:hypothetical protein
MFRWLMAALVLGVFAGCSKQADLPDVVVAASSREEFARFRAELGGRFPAERLADFDTATRELQLDAMNRDVVTPEARETDMRRAINGKTVHAAIVLGWGARKARFLREIAEITRMLEHDLALQAKSAAVGTPETVLRRIGSEREILAKLQLNLAETERRLAAWAEPRP